MGRILIHFSTRSNKKIDIFCTYFICLFLRHFLNYLNYILGIPGEYNKKSKIPNLKTLKLKINVVFIWCVVIGVLQL